MVTWTHGPMIPDGLQKVTLDFTFENDLDERHPGRHKFPPHGEHRLAPLSPWTILGRPPSTLRRAQTAPLPPPLPHLAQYCDDLSWMRPMDMIWASPARPLARPPASQRGPKCGPKVRGPKGGPKGRVTH